MLAQLVQNNGKNLSKEQLKNILKKYFNDIETLEFPEDLSNSNIKLNIKQSYGGYKNILLSTIYNGKLSRHFFSRAKYKCRRLWRYCKLQHNFQ